MDFLKIFLIILAIIAIALIANADSGRIYGKIYTLDDEVFEGLIRWDRNEVSWVDVLDGSKDIPRRNYRESRRSRRGRGRETSFEIFGLKFKSGDNSFWSSNAQSGIRFGHIRTMEVVGDDRVLLILKSGEELELEGGSTDIGDDIREIIIEDKNEGEIEFVWDDIEKIEFSSTKPNLKSKLGYRLYGTLTTRRGDEYKGFVCWDIDETLSEDILDGDSRKRRRKIEFKDIKAIERYSSSAATVIFHDDEEIVLRGTNDVDDDNRGIIICDPGFGQVRVSWGEFERLDFSPMGKAVSYEQFDGGKKLRGTVFTDEDESYTGDIRWDNDEEYTWEFLNGDYRGADFYIEMGLIKSIEKKSRRTALITVKDGRTFRLRGSNDVDEDNKGIFITLANGDVEVVEWDEFDRVEFSH